MKVGEVEGPESVFSLTEVTAFLARTPSVLRSLLTGLPEGWRSYREHQDSWTAVDVVGHLVHGEDDDWLPRTRRILEQGESVPFAPFDQNGHKTKYGAHSLEQLLDLFAKRRAERLTEFSALGLREEDLDRTGVHPAFGRVTLRQLLSSWVAHDLNHIWQISRILARYYRNDVGPWTAFLKVMRDGS